MTEFTWDPESYRSIMAEEVPEYPRLQHELTTAATEHSAHTALDLGIGSGLTARKVAEAMPHAHFVGLDDSLEMLAAAREALEPFNTTLIRGRLEEALPQGPFDLVMSTLAVHHLNENGKADLFERIAHVLAGGGRFVLADLVVPPDPADVITPIDGVIDTPSTLADQLNWLHNAGLHPRVHWHHRDLAVIVAKKQ